MVTTKGKGSGNPEFTRKGQEKDLRLPTVSFSGPPKNIFNWIDTISDEKREN
jgi:hypothetical protein